MENKQEIKEFGLSNFSISNRTSVFVLIFMIVIVGMISYDSMPKESFPEIKQPTIYVGTIYPGNAPLEIENLITRPIEKELNTISGINKLKSTNIQGYSTVIAEFDFDVDVKEALQEVKDAVDKAKAELPNDLPAEPDVFELDFSEMPVMNINLYGDVHPEKLRQYGEYLEDEIEKLGEITGVDIRGVQEKEVKIDVDVAKMEAKKVSFRDIEQAIGQENVTISGGDILTKGVRKSLRVTGEFTRVDQIEEVIVKSERGNAIYLKDIANVEFGYAERTSYARLDGFEVVTLDVKKRGGENLLNASDKIKAIIEKAQATRFPDNLQVKITNDQSKDTRDMVANLENNIISGVILVVLVLLMFLGLRNAMFVGVAIPLSMLMSFIILNMAGMTLNTMVLFSLILALGMLVDNGIVVVENIYRMMSEGKGSITAARHGVGEVAWPIISSTATTLAAFAPLIFWKDIIGEFMKFLPITLMIVLGCSLFVGLVVNPVLTAVFMKLQDKKSKVSKKFVIGMIGMTLIGVLLFLAVSKLLGAILVITGIFLLINAFLLRPFGTWFQDKILTRVEDFYNSVIKFALKGLGGFMPYIMLVGTFVILIGTFMFFGANTPPITFFPSNTPKYVNVFVEMPLGTDIAETDKFTQKVEEKIKSAISPYAQSVEAIIALVGEGTSDPAEGVSLGKSPHKSRVTVSFVEYTQRGGISTNDVMKAIQEKLKGLSGGKISVAKNSEGPPVGKAISVELSGEDYDDLIQTGNDLKAYFDQQNIAGIEDLSLDVESGKPEAVIHINRESARRFGLSTAQIASTIRTALYGKEISKYKEGKDDYPIQLRFNAKDRYNLETILNQKITFRDQSSGTVKQIPIRTVAYVEDGSSLGSIKRLDTDRIITLSSNVLEGYNAAAIVSQLKLLNDQFEAKEGVMIKFAGEQEKQDETMAFLMQAFMIAVFIIALILITQFNSVLMPVIILLTVLFSLIGVFLGFTVTQMEISILMTGIGIISLAGVVVNNAIVLIDYANLLREQKKEALGLGEDERLPATDLAETIMEAGRTRLRPVLLTAITTVLGLIPLAIGLNINFFTLLTEFDGQIYLGGDSTSFWAPMAWTVIFGLVFATFLTLVLVPVMYWLIDRAKYLGEKLFGSVTQ